MDCSITLRKLLQLTKTCQYTTRFCNVQVSCFIFVSIFSCLLYDHGLISVCGIVSLCKSRLWETLFMLWKIHVVLSQTLI